MDLPGRRDLPAELHSRLSHDIRSRINIILGYCDILAEGSNASDSHRLQTLRNTAQLLLVTDEEIRHLVHGLPDTLPSLRQHLDSTSRKRPDFTFTGGKDIDDLPSEINAMLISVTTKFVLAYNKCHINVQREPGNIIVDLNPDSQDRYPLDDFLKRFKTPDTIDPKKNFDIYYLASVGNALDAAVTVNEHGLRVRWQTTP